MRHILFFLCMPRSMGYGILKFKGGAVNMLFFLSVPLLGDCSAKGTQRNEELRRFYLDGNAGPMAYLDPARLEI